MLKQQQINKKEPYYGTTDDEITMPSEQSLHKAHNDKCRMQTLAERDPKVSRTYSELIKRSVWNWRGQTHFAERLSNWIDTAHKWSEFKEILPKKLI